MSSVKKATISTNDLEKAIKKRINVSSDDLFEKSYPFYFKKLNDNLICEMPPQVIDAYKRGSGKEFEWKLVRGKKVPPKMHALLSSSAMTFNVFWNKRDNRKVRIKDNKISKSFGLKEGIYNLEFEKQLPALYPKAPANLDACLSSIDGENIILFEMKMTEWFKRPKGIRKAYLKEEKYPNSDIAKVFIELIDTFKSGENKIEFSCRFEHFDVFQMLKHILGAYNCISDVDQKPKTVKLIAGIWMITDKSFFLGANEKYDNYKHIEKKMRDEFKEFLEAIDKVNIKRFFKEKEVDFNVKEMSVKEIISCLDKTDDEIKALRRYI